MASERQRKVIRRAYRQAFMESAVGRVVLADLEVECFARRSTYESDSAMGMAFNEGKRWIWLRILDICDVSQQEMDSVVSKAKLQMED